MRGIRLRDEQLGNFNQNILGGIREENKKMAEVLGLKIKEKSSKLVLEDTEGRRVKELYGQVRMSQYLREEVKRVEGE